MELALKPEERIAFIRVATAGRRLGVTRQTIYTLIALNQLASANIDEQVFVRAHDVEQLRLEREAARQTA